MNKVRKPGAVGIVAPDRSTSYYMARFTFPALRHLVHTLRRLVVPSTSARTF
jgi:hypothetical protein